MPRIGNIPIQVGIGLATLHCVHNRTQKHTNPNTAAAQLQSTVPLRRRGLYTDVYSHSHARKRARAKSLSLCLAQGRPQAHVHHKNIRVYKARATSIYETLCGVYTESILYICCAAGSSSSRTTTTSRPPRRKLVCVV